MNAGGAGSNAGQGGKIPHVSQHPHTHTKEIYIYIYITKKQYYNKFHKILKKNQYGFGIRKDPRPPKIQ